MTPSAVIRKRLFDSVFPTALRRIAKIEEEGDRVNLAIRLILPLAMWGRQEGGRQAKTPISGLTPRSYANDTGELIERLTIQAEKDYLTRLFLTESIPFALYSDDEIERLIDSIKGDEEREAALAAWGLALAEKPSEKARAESVAQRLDDLGTYEKTLRAMITAPFRSRNSSDNITGNNAEINLDTAGEPDAVLMEKVESAVGRARLFAELAGCRVWEETPERAADFLNRAKSALAEIDAPNERDDAALFLFERAGRIEFPALEPLAASFADPLLGLRALRKYFCARFLESLGPLQCADPLEKKSVLDAARRFAAAAIADPDRRIRLGLEAAALFYAANDSRSARNSVREMLPLLSTLENPAQKATLFQRLIKILLGAGENKAADKIFPLLEKATDAIMPDDLAELLWREHLLVLIRAGAADRAKTYLEKIGSPTERAVFEVALLLQKGETDEAALPKAFGAILESIAAEPDSLTAATALVKICR